ncbi:hypothetical protein MLD38_003425 [Melastoma candidum]|uniref:Uncharacterized protein n=1 Tax=Melastoma candidum TaxID=119954 RepID=A0ACB9S270_9MYRT|nr:hypothetical protein MLD38_003425 [Melastoma candidum]
MKGCQNMVQLNRVGITVRPCSSLEPRGTPAVAKLIKSSRSPYLAAYTKIAIAINLPVGQASPKVKSDAEEEKEGRHMSSNASASSSDVSWFGSLPHQGWLRCCLGRKPDRIDPN